MVMAREFIALLTCADWEKLWVKVCNEVEPICDAESENFCCALLPCIMRGGYLRRALYAGSIAAAAKDERDSR